MIWRLVVTVAAAVVLVQAQCPCRLYADDPSYVICDDPSLTSIPDCVASDITKLSIGSPNIPLVPETISRFKQLKRINVDGMDDPRLAKNFLEGHPYLEFFQIYVTGLTYVDNEWFMFSPRIKTMILSYNSIFSLPADTFNYVPMLEYVELKSNRLTTLPPTLFEGTALKSVDLNYNQWSCDCELAEFVQWTRDRGVTIGNDAYCYYPTELQGLNLVNLTPDLGCAKDRRNKLKP